MRYVRNSALRARGQRPSNLLLARGAVRRARSNVEAILASTAPVIERARERGTEASGTIRRINRLAQDALRV